MCDNTTTASIQYTLHRSEVTTHHCTWGHTEEGTVVTHSLSCLFHSQYAAALWEVHGLCCLVPSHACPLVEQELIGCGCHARLQALQSSSVHPPTLTHSPLPLPAPAEGTQGQVSRYKQLLPSVCRGKQR